VSLVHPRLILTWPSVTRSQERRQINNTDNTETKHNPEKKQTKQNTAKQNYSRFLRYSARKRGGLFYNAPRPTHYCSYTETL